MTSYRLSLASLIIAGIVLATTTTGRAEEQAPQPRIEVCFVLDTTGSMGGLIEGAKQKIWSIANDLAGVTANTDRPRPSIRIGLVAYRDRGDEYVTRCFDLSDDLDAIYGHLMGFQAGGGGDMPESVNQALHDAVHNMSWSQGEDLLKLIFLVGDAPPHMNYPDDVKYPETCQLAVRKNIILNTIQCGNIAATTPYWQEIASLGEGSYAAIGQSGDVVQIATPVDADIARLNRFMAETVVTYGSAQVQAEARAKQARAASTAAPAAADRLLYLREADGDTRAISGAGDLVADVAEGKATLSELPAEQLPEVMKSMTEAEREAYVKQQTQRRAEIQAELVELLKQRQAHLDAQRKRLAEEGRTNSFDDQVAAMVREQAQRRGLIPQPQPE